MIQPKPLVYLCGPYRLPDPVSNTAEAMERGREVYDVTGAPVLIPHLSLFQHLQRSDTDDYWLAYTMDQMRCCDAVYRFSNRFSSGSDAEEAEAIRLGIPVFKSLPALAEWVSQWGVTRESDR